MRIACATRRGHPRGPQAVPYVRRRWRRDSARPARAARQRHASRWRRRRRAGPRHLTPSIASLADYRIPEGMLTAGTVPAADLAREVRRRSDHAVAQAKRLEAASRGLPGSDSGSLVDRLTTIRVLIEQDPGLRVFYTTTAPAGFDTHAAQLLTHRELLRQTSSAVAGFLKDLHKRGLGERVVVLIFSEFGRRVRENAQGGTDHGAAGPVFLAGSLRSWRPGRPGPRPGESRRRRPEIHRRFPRHLCYALTSLASGRPRACPGRRDEALPIV